MEKEESSICTRCDQPMVKRKERLFCPNGCDQLTVQVPTYRNARSMSYESMGDGCFVKKAAKID
jgi:hypothetical protein